MRARAKQRPLTESTDAAKEVRLVTGNVGIMGGEDPVQISYAEGITLGEVIAEQKKRNPLWQKSDIRVGRAGKSYNEPMSYKIQNGDMVIGIPHARIVGGAVADVLTKEVWFGGTQPLQGRADTARLCLGMAVSVAYEIGEVTEVARRVREAITALFPDRLPSVSVSGGYLVQFFNDHKDTTFDDVMRVCKVANV